MCSSFLYLHFAKTIRVMKCFFFSFLLVTAMGSFAPNLTAQTPQDAALIDAAMQMNFIDWYRNATNGSYDSFNPGKGGSDTFFNDISVFAVSSYEGFRGTYRGRTWNRSANKSGDTWLTLGNINYDQGAICVQAGWYNGLVGSIHLEAPMTEANVFSGEGYLYYDNQAKYAIQIFLFMLGDRRTLKGVCALDPLTDDGYRQVSTFVLRK